MDITPFTPKNRQTINGYGGGGFKINQERVEGSLLVFSDRHVTWSGQLTLAGLQPVLDEKGVELLLIGTGQQMQPIGDDIRQALKAKHIAVETMDTGAACRTFNVLISEERRVAGAFIAV